MVKTLSTSKVGKALDKKQTTDTVAQLVEKLKPQIELALPRHINIDRFARIVMTELRKNPKLMQCSDVSLMGALMTAGELGLEIGSALGQAYLVPYKQEVQFIRGYKGDLSLLRRSGEVSLVYAKCVYSNEEFDIEFGTDPKITHKPNLTGEQGTFLGAYAVIKYKDGSHQFDFMTKKEIDKRKREAKTTFVWDKWYDEMAKKTVLKYICKTADLSPELQEKLTNDNVIKQYEEGKKMSEIHETDTFIDVDVSESEDVNISEPEIIDEKKNNKIGADEIIKIKECLETYKKTDEQLLDYLKNIYDIESKTDILMNDFNDIIEWIKTDQ